MGGGWWWSGHSFAHFTWMQKWLTHMRFFYTFAYEVCNFDKPSMMGTGHTEVWNTKHTTITGTSFRRLSHDVLLGSDYAINKAAQYWEAVHLYYVSNHKFTGFPRSVLVYKLTTQSIRTVNKENKTQHLWHSLGHPVWVVGHCGCDSRHVSSFSHTEWWTTHTALTPMLTTELRDHWHCDWGSRQGQPSNHTKWWTKHTALTLSCLPQNWRIAGTATEMVGKSDHQTTQNGEQYVLCCLMTQLPNTRILVPNVLQRKR